MNSSIQNSRATFAEFTSENRKSPPPNEENEISSSSTIGSTSFTRSDSKFLPAIKYHQEEASDYSFKNSEERQKSTAWKASTTSTSTTSKQQPTSFSKDKRQVILGTIEPNIRQSPRQMAKKLNNEKKSFIKDEVSMFVDEQDEVSGASSSAPVLEQDEIVQAETCSEAEYEDEDLYEKYEHEDFIPSPKDDLRESTDSSDSIVLSPELKEIAQLMNRQTSDTGRMSKKQWEFIETHASNELSALIQSKKHFVTFKTDPLRLMVGRNQHMVALFCEYLKELRRNNTRQQKGVVEEDQGHDEHSDKSLSSTKNPIVDLASPDPSEYEAKLGKSSSCSSSSKERSSSSSDGSKKNKNKRHRHSTKASRCAKSANAPAIETKVVRRFTKPLLYELAKSFAAATHYGRMPLKYMESTASMALQQYMEYKKEHSPTTYMLAPLISLVPVKFREEFDVAVDGYTDEFPSKEDEGNESDSRAGTTEMSFKDNLNPGVETVCTTENPVVEIVHTKKKAGDKKRHASTTDLMSRAFVLERKRRVQQFAENLRVEVRDFEEKECNLWDAFLKFQNQT
jgi:hypothetical protein